MSYSAIHIANSILRRAFDEEIPVTPMKLQKLLYFVTAYYGKRTGRDLITENFQTWKYGPVVSSVHYKFRPFGSDAINAFGKDIKGNGFVADESKDADLRTALDSVWHSAKNIPAVDLAQLTHAENSAWWKAYTTDKSVLSASDVRSDSTYLNPLRITLAV